MCVNRDQRLASTSFDMHHRYMSIGSEKPHLREQREVTLPDRQKPDSQVPKECRKYLPASL